jgi:hypothetical protein
LKEFIEAQFVFVAAKRNTILFPKGKDESFKLALDKHDLHSNDSILGMSEEER